MIAGTTLNAMIMPVHTMLLADNRIRFMLFSHIFGFIVAVPTIILLTLKFGVIGGAISVLLLFGGYITIQAPLIFKSLNLKDSLLSWYLNDMLYFVAPLTVLSLVLTQFKKYVVNADRVQLFLALAAVTIAYYFIILLLNRRLLTYLWSRCKSIFRRQPI